MGSGRAARVALDGGGPTVIAGFGGGVEPQVRSGDVVLADELRTSRGVVACRDPTDLAAVLRGAGLRVWVGPIWSDGRLVVGAERAAVRETGAVAVDMESAALAERLSPPPIVLRVIVDTAASELYRPWRTLTHGLAALMTLRRVGGLLSGWANAPSPPSRPEPGR